MDTFEDKYQREENVYAGDDEGRFASVKRKLGNVGRRIKRVDLRSRIVDNPFAAIGIAVGVGALVGLARPMPKRGPISGALMAVASTIGFRMLREAAMIQLGQYARGLISKDESGMQANVPQAGY